MLAQLLLPVRLETIVFHWSASQMGFISSMTLSEACLAETVDLDKTGVL